MISNHNHLPSNNYNPSKQNLIPHSSFAAKPVRWDTPSRLAAASFLIPHSSLLTAHCYLILLSITISVVIFDLITSLAPAAIKRLTK